MRRGAIPVFFSGLQPIWSAARQPRVVFGNNHLAYDAPTARAVAMVVVWLAWNYWVAAKSLPLPNVACAQDLGVMVDAGYRFYQGLRPHADYHTPFGPVLGMLFGIPMVFGGPNYSSLRFLPATVTGITVAWTWFACGYSLGSASRAVIAIALGAIAGGLYHQGFPPEALTFATFYNRVGFGILGVVALCTLLPREKDRVVSNTFRDGSIIVGVVTLAFFKAVFAVAAVPLVMTSLVVHQRTKRDYGVCIAAGGMCLVFFLASIGFRVDRMWQDLLLSAGARGQNGGTGLFFFPLRNAIANIDFICLAIVSGVLWLPAAVTPSSIWRSPTAWGMYVLWMPVVIGWGLTLIQSHGDGRGIALMLVGLGASYAWLRVKPGDVIGRIKCPESSSGELLTDPIRHRVSAACLWLAAFLFIMPHAQSLLFLRRISSETSGRQFRAPAVRDLFIGPFANELGPDCITKMNDAIDLISRHCEKNDTLQYMGGANIYSFACGLRSPRDSMLFWCSYSTYSAAHHPPTRDFDATKFILVPKASVSVSQTPEDWKQAYSYYFATHFTVCEETQYFLLYKRKS
jgi:hypothetical protein